MANPGILPMAAFLLQNAGGNMGQVPAASAPVEEEIAVSGRNPYDRKGLFGMKGTLRDVLGTIGDAFLVQSGNRQIYSPIRQRENIADAMRGFTDDPLGSIRALNKAGFPEQAQSLYQDFTKNEQVKATQELARRKFDQDLITDQALIGQRTLSGQDKAVNIASRMMSNITNDEEYQRRLPALKAFLEKNGLEKFANDLPTKFGPEVSKWGLQQYQAQRLEDFDAQQQLNETREANLSAHRNEQRSETGRHNRATEGIAAQRAATYDRTAGQRGSRGRPEIPPRAPKAKGDAIRSPSGATFTSPDGKRWVRTN